MKEDAPGEDPGRVAAVLAEMLAGRMAALLARLGPPPAGAPLRLGVAVSGGGDSMALLHLLAGWAETAGVSLQAVTVDHGLRPASRAEAEMVGEVCATIGVGHAVLSWQGWDGSGNLQDQARRARYGLMTDWARREGVAGIALAHTRDDQAETFLMRLARGAGVDGLSAMAPLRRSLGVAWLRPLLDCGREDLRAFLRHRGLGWVEDPSNADPRFERVRTRQVLAELAPLGLTAEGLRAATARLAEARAALAEVTAEAAARIARVEAGDVVFDAAALAALPAEIRRRLLVEALVWVASAEYRPRQEALAEAQAALAAGRAATLHGCLLRPGGGALRVTREWQAVRGLRVPVAEVWDRRWRAVPEATRDPADKAGKARGAVAAAGTPPGAPPPLEIAALGETGLALCPEWRETGVPRRSLLASPALWRGAELVAAPLAGQSRGWRIELVRGAEDFQSGVLSH